MENRNSILGMLKELMSQYGKAKFVEVPLIDGSVLIVSGDSPVVGGTAMITTDAGEVAAPDGDYELPDGTTITVVGGAITAINKEEPQPEPTEPAPAAMSEELKSIVSGFEERIKALENKYTETLSKLETANKSVADAEQKMAAQAKVLNETFSLIEKVLNLPEEKQIKKPLETIKVDNSADKFSKMAAAFKTIKSN